MDCRSHIFLPSCFFFPAATTEQAPHGSVTFLPENDELAAEETVEIIYSPPAGMFEGAESLLYCGGFNGWDGEEDGMTMPMMPVEDEGKFRISINVPNFARVSDLAAGGRFGCVARRLMWVTAVSWFLEDEFFGHRRKNTLRQHPRSHVR